MGCCGLRRVRGRKCAPPRSGSAAIFTEHEREWRGSRAQRALCGCASRALRPHARAKAREKTRVRASRPPRRRGMRALAGRRRALHLLPATTRSHPGRTAASVSPKAAAPSPCPAALPWPAPQRQTTRRRATARPRPRPRPARARPRSAHAPKLGRHRRQSQHPPPAPTPPLPCSGAPPPPLPAPLPRHSSPRPTRARCGADLMRADRALLRPCPAHTRRVGRPRSTRKAVGSTPYVVWKSTPRHG